MNSIDFKIDGLLSAIWEGRGKVVLATHATSKKSYAIKIFDLEKCADEISSIEQEARMLRFIHHSNICPIISSFCPPNCQEAWLVLPSFLCSAQSLIADQYAIGVPEGAIAIIVRDVLLALQYLHSKCIIHRSIQARHILISSSGHAVLSGFRQSVEHSAARHDGCATLHQYPAHPKTLLNWASPEMLQQDLRGYSFPTDVYSLGLTVCELGNGEEPYQGLPSTLMMVEKLRGLVPFVRDASNMVKDGSLNNSCGSSLDSVGGLKLSGDHSSNSSSSCKMLAQQTRLLSESLHQFVRKCLALNPLQRPTPLILLSNDPFVRQAKKATPQALLSVLQLQNISNCCKDLGNCALEEELSAIAVDDTSWEFDN